MFGIGWKHRVARKVMIELLYAEGIRWAGWYLDRNLIAKWDEVMGGYMRDPLRPGRARRWTPVNGTPVDGAPVRKTVGKGKVTIDWPELDRWLAEG